MNKDYQDKVIVALDTPSMDFTRKLVKSLGGLIRYYKIGFELFTAHGWKAVELVKKQGANVFLDLKLHDIPNTVSRAAAVIAEYEVDMFNVHASGGLEMMTAARKIVEERITLGGKKKPVMLGVTVLTSHTQQTLKEDLGTERKLEDQVVHLAKLVKKAGLNGVVSSPREVTLLRKEFKSDFLIVTPGIRAAGQAAGDQKRTFSAREALEAGSDYIVVGRPITGANDPAGAAKELLATLV